MLRILGKPSADVNGCDPVQQLYESTHFSWASMLDKLEMGMWNLIHCCEISQTWRYNDNNNNNHDDDDDDVKRIKRGTRDCEVDEAIYPS